MKQVPLLIALAFSLSLCNLSEKFKKSGNSNSTSSGSSPTRIGDDPVELPSPTGAQQAAIANGQTAKWNQQGMSWTLPANWKQVTNESKELVWRSPGSSDAANLIVSISPMDESFPTEISIKAFYDGEMTRSKNGEVDELKWLEIDGVRGFQFRESNPEKPDGIRRMQWMAYRKYAGQVQLVNVMLSSSGKGFPQHQDEMYGVLYSTKITH
ncbi:MAG: hypothetical protein ABJC05_00500 [Pyrinomonadaceae bacterium]